MNRIKDLVIQFCKFGAVGGLCFGIDYGLMIFLTETHIMHYFASSAVSFTVSVIVNYILSMRFVFIGKEDMNECGSPASRSHAATLSASGPEASYEDC